MTIAWGILLASGSDEEFEQSAVAGFLNLNSRPILSYSLRACEDCPDLEGYIVVAPRDRLEQVQAQAQLFGCHKIRKIVPGGATYATALNQGMEYLDDQVNTVLVHEVAIPFVTAQMMSDVIKASKKSGVALVGSSLPDAVATLGKNRVLESIGDASSLMRVTAPYAFSLEYLNKAIKAAKTKKKRLKSPMDLIGLVKAEVKVAPVDLFPERVRSIGDLTRLDALMKS